MPRKYDIEMLKELAAQPKKKGGRPKKYHTEEERRLKDLERHRIANQRAKFAANGEEIPEELRVKKVRKYASEEERIEADKIVQARYRSAQREACRLSTAVARYRAMVECN